MPARVVSKHAEVSVFAGPSLFCPGLGMRNVKSKTEGHRSAQTPMQICARSPSGTSGCNPGSCRHTGLFCCWRVSHFVAYHALLRVWGDIGVGMMRDTIAASHCPCVLHQPFGLSCVHASASVWSLLFCTCFACCLICQHTLASIVYDLLLLRCRMMQMYSCVHCVVIFPSRIALLTAGQDSHCGWV